jgi:peptidoglycan/xylan/chitin deacetylase (PgdA/CDA1 family)
VKDYLYPLAGLLSKAIPSALVKKYVGQFIPVFMLHRLTPTNTNKDEPVDYLKHVEWCLSYVRRNNYNPITLMTLARYLENGMELPEKSVVFTFDDGFYDQYEVALPLFSRFDINFTCFVITDFLDNKLWPWDDQIKYAILESKVRNSFKVTYANIENIIDLSSEENRKKSIENIRDVIKRNDQKNLYQWLALFYEKLEVDMPKEIPDEFKPMTWSQAQELINKGNEVSAHTKTHRILSCLSNDDAKYEISHSVRRVSEKLSGSSPLFAYPTGRLRDFLQRDIENLRKMKIKLSVTTEARHVFPNDNLYLIPRFPLPKSKFQFIEYLSCIEAIKQKYRGN